MTGIIEISLKQHSPLIHYQGNQPGSFLSVSALKAAIDYNMDNGLVGNRKRVIYSLDIKPEELVKKDYCDLVGQRNKLFFADMGQDHAASVTVYTRKKIVLKIGEFRRIANTPEQEGFYEAGFMEGLKYTLAFHNFGKRGSKGFGCFWIAEGQSLEEYLKKNLPSGWGLYKIPVSASCYEALIKRCFEVIDAYYKNLKSGINCPRLLYAKSVLMRYLNGYSTPVTWDKRHIKDRFISNSIPIGKKMFRFRLGLAQNHDYLSRDFTINYQTMKNGVSSDIARIPSPISFKISCSNSTTADILIFVNPSVNEPEYNDLNGLTIRATRNPTDAGTPLDMALADLSDLDLNDLLCFAQSNLLAGIVRAPNMGYAQSLSDTLNYIQTSLVKVR